MQVREAIDRRRAYRSLEPVEITEEMVNDLAAAAHKAPSCFNNQPWRFVFVYGKEQLEVMHEALTKGNAWAKDASLMVVVLSKPDLDCQPKDRDYYMFDTGLATANLMLRATEMGLVAHPTAGYSVSKTREVLDIPEEFTVITILHVGKLSSKVSGHLEEWQQERDTGPRIRRPLETVAHHNRYDSAKEPGDEKDKGAEFGWPEGEWMDVELEWPSDELHGG
jgi:nitroreductase